MTNQSSDSQRSKVRNRANKFMKELSPEVYVKRIQHRFAQFNWLLIPAQSCHPAPQKVILNPPGSCRCSPRNMWHPAINFKNLASRLQDKSRCRQNIFIMHPAILSLVIPYPATPSLSRFHPLCISPSTPALQVAYSLIIRISNICLQSYNSKNRNMLTGHYWTPYI